MRTYQVYMVKTLSFTKVRREIEPKWVSWYVKEHYPDAEVRLRCPLGPLPAELKQLHGPAKAARVYRPSRPEVDALIIMDDELILIEAKIQKYMDGLAKLPVYASLVPETDELSVFHDRPLTMHLLIPVLIPWVVAAAPRLDVTVKTSAPDWLLPIWEERDKYWQPAARIKRADRRAFLKSMGYE